MIAVSRSALLSYFIYIYKSIYMKVYIYISMYTGFFTAVANGSSKQK